MKQCTKCKEIKPLSEFHKQSGGGYNYQCKTCRNIYLKQYRIDNKEVISKKSKQYRRDNPDIVKDKSRRHRERNKVNISKKGKIYNNSYAIYETFVHKLTVEESPRLASDGVSLEVKCKYCGDYFKPRVQDVSIRAQSIKGSTGGEHSLYCSENCKQSCGTYRQMKYPKGHTHCTSREVQPQLRKMVFERDHHVCTKCGRGKDILPIHCHHIDPVINNPIESADMDNCKTLCIDCHHIAHQVPGCTIGELRCEV